MTLRVVAVSGSLRSPSTTELLLDGILDELAAHVEIDRELIELHPLAVDLAVTLTKGVRSDAVTAALEAVSAADVLVVATPIYRGSYTGLFKQFVDALHQDAIVGVPVLLAVGGGNDQHSLAIDHELRPLFAFFRAHTLPVGVYARAADFEASADTPSGKRIVADGALPGAIARAVDAALPTLRAAAS